MELQYVPPQTCSLRQWPILTFTGQGRFLYEAFQRSSFNRFSSNTLLMNFPELTVIHLLKATKWLYRFQKLSPVAGGSMHISEPVRFPARDFEALGKRRPWVAATSALRGTNSSRGIRSYFYSEGLISNYCWCEYLLIFEVFGHIFPT